VNGLQDIIDKSQKKRLFKKWLYHHLSSTVFYICLIAFFWYAAHPTWIEKRLFVNEIFSLIGFYLFLSKPVLHRKNDCIYNCVIFIIFVFSAYVFASLMFFESFYGYLRNTVLVYSVFAFFLGIRLYDALMKIGKKNLLLISAFLPSGDFYRTSYAAMLPLYLSKHAKRFNWWTVLFIITIMLGVKIYYGGSTSIAVILLLVFFYILNNKFKLPALIIAISLSILFFIFMQPHLYALTNEYNLYDLISMNYIFQIDGNATTRAFMWAYLFYEVFLDNVMGIGLGTTMFPWEFYHDKLQMWEISDPYLEYTLGAHNSFLTVLVRFGFIGVLPFVILYRRIIKDFMKDKRDPTKQYTLYFYFSFLIVSGCALVAVVLESPMHASLYWGSLGILYQAKRKPYSNPE